MRTGIWSSPKCRRRRQRATSCRKAGGRQPARGEGGTWRRRIRAGPAKPTRRPNRAADEADAQTAEIALKGFMVSCTDYPLWSKTIRRFDSAVAQRAGGRQGAWRCALGRAHRQITARRASTPATSNRFQGSLMHAMDRRGYGAPAGALRRAHGHRPRCPGGLDRSRQLSGCLSISASWITQLEFAVR